MVCYNDFQMRILLYFYIGLSAATFSSSKWANVYSDHKCQRREQALYCNTVPTGIPANITSVFLQDVNDRSSIQKQSFSGKNWKNVIFLQISQSAEGRTEHQIENIEPYGMEGLSQLVELRIMSDVFKGLERGSFYGLHNLRVLNFTGCARLTLSKIANSINGTTMLPKLETLSMSYLSTYMGGIILGKDFFGALKSKPVKSLDIHHTQIVNFQLKYTTGILNTLQYLNFSKTKIQSIDPHEIDGLEMKNPVSLDASFASLPLDILTFIRYLPFISNTVLDIDLKKYSMMSNIPSINLSGINNKEISVQFNNITIHTTSSNWTTKVLIARKNNLKILDLTIPCVHSSLQKLDLSSNGLEFFQPKMCTCCFNLEEINFSNNKLYKMAKKNFTVFGQLITYFPNLQHIDLSGNLLETIPSEIFKTAGKLQTIDLSNNRIAQVTFSIKLLKDLWWLNLRSNKIKILDSISLTNLQQHKGKKSCIFYLENNPISCDACDTLASIKWIVQNQAPDNHSEKCKTKDGDLLPLKKIAIETVQKICLHPQRIRNIIIFSTLVPLAGLLIIISIFFIVRKHQQKIKYRKSMKEKIQRIGENKAEFKYVVFLSYSSEDGMFFNQNVYNPLKEHMENIIGTNRDLICFGDKNFRLGKPINDEIVHCLNESAVVLILVSRNFCTSEFCRMEFDHALLMRKAIILIIKEHVDEDQMVPSMREVFKQNTRILFENQDGNMQLMTTWDNVCNSILDLVEV